MSTVFDPKIILAKKKAEDDIADKLRNHSFNINTMIKHRGRVNLMMKDGSFLSGDIKICTTNLMVFQDVSWKPGVGLMHIKVSDVADCEIL